MRPAHMCRGANGVLLAEHLLFTSQPTVIRDYDTNPAGPPAAPSLILGIRNYEVADGGMVRSPVFKVAADTL